MDLPCETIVRYVLPFFRSRVAKELIEKYKFTQMETAEKLGTTQAAISQYLHSKRGYKGTEHFQATLPMIQSAVNETAKYLASGNMDADEFIVGFCKLCASLREGMTSK